MSLSAPRLIVRAGLLVVAAAVAGSAPTGASAASGPVVVASLAAKDGTLVGPMRVRAKQTRVKVGSKRCTVAAGTPLAALVALRAKVGASSVGALRIVDRGRCGSRARSSSRLAVVGIGADRARGGAALAYAVGGRVSGTRPADPAGPFGRGLLEENAEIAWRWCGGVRAGCGDALEVLAFSYDDTVRGDASAGVDLSITVKVRQGATASSSGELHVPPAGTDVAVITPSGERIDGATTGGGGIFRLHAAAAPPAGSRVVATAPGGVAPGARLWPAFGQIPS